MSDHWQNVKLWDLGASPAKMVPLLRNGSPLEQVLLHCLLLGDKSPRQLPLQQHDGAAILDDLAATSPYAVRKLAIEFAQTVVMTLDVDSRSQLIDFQVRHRHVPLLSLDFLKTLVDYQYVILPEMECREFLKAVRTGTAAQIYDFVDSRHGMEFSYFFQRGLFPAIFERMRNESTSDDVLRRLWWLLLYILKKVGPYPAIDGDHIQGLVTTLLHEIGPVANNRNRRFRRMAAKLFQTDLLFTPNRNLVIANGGTPIFVQALAYEAVEDVADRLTGLLQGMLPK